MYTHGLPQFPSWQQLLAPGLVNAMHFMTAKLHVAQASGEYPKMLENIGSKIKFQKERKINYNYMQLFDYETLNLDPISYNW